MEKYALIFFHACQGYSKLHVGAIKAELEGNRGTDLLIGFEPTADKNLGRTA